MHVSGRPRVSGANFAVQVGRIDEQQTGQGAAKQAHVLTLEACLGGTVRQTGLVWRQLMSLSPNTQRLKMDLT